MPDYTGAYRSTDSWVTRGSPADVLPRLAAVVGATVTSDGAVETTVGSRVAMRLWGVLIPTRKIPLRVRLTAAQAESGTRVSAEATSNQGWYAMSVSRMASRIYERGFAELFNRLREVAPPN